MAIKLVRNWSGFQLASSAPPLSVTDSAITPSAGMAAAAGQVARGPLRQQGACWHEIASPGAAFRPALQHAAWLLTGGLLRELNPGPLRPKPRIMPLDQAAVGFLCASARCMRNTLGRKRAVKARIGSTRARFASLQLRGKAYSVRHQTQAGHENQLLARLLSSAGRACAS